ncbi:MAG: hypothetical protein IH944_11825, partial [Armatimonadetes bacterium]|nr:hypothetical protein [Armatimonadota bacterium]
QWHSGYFDMPEEVLDFFELARYFTVALTPRGNRMADLRERWMHKVAAPTKYDPLQPLQTEMLVGAARALDANLVASVPDDAILWLNHMLEFPAVQPSMTVSYVMGIVSKDWHCDARMSGGWLTVRPKSFAAAHDAYLDRGALESAMLRAVREQRLTIANLATYGTRQSSTMALTMSDGRLLALAAGRSVGSAIYYNRYPLLFLGATKIFETPLQQTEFQFNAAQLSKEARDVLAAWAFGDSWQNTFGLDYLWEDREPDAAHPLGHISKRPTEAMPDGVPAMLVGKITLKTEPGLAVLYGPDKNWSAPIIWRAEGFGGFGVDELVADRTAKAQTIEQTVLRLEFMLGPKLGLVAEMEDPPAVDPDAWVTFGDLPANVIEFWLAKQRAREQPEKAPAQKPPPN